LAALPQGQRLFEGAGAGLEAFHGSGQLGASVLIGQFRFGHDVSSVTVAVSSPAARRIRSSSPGATSDASRSTVEPRRTTAYPRSRVAAGESARRRASVWLRSLPARSRRWVRVRAD